MRPTAPDLDLPNPSEAPADTPSIPPVFSAIRPVDGLVPDDVPTNPALRRPEGIAVFAAIPMAEIYGMDHASVAADQPGFYESHPSAVRPLQDNVLVYLKPKPTRSSTGALVLPQNRGKRGTAPREAIVLATGPGWRLRDGRGPLVPVEVQAGECVVVDEMAGQDWAFDVSKPRGNPKGCQWDAFPVPTVHERVGGEYRMVRADECLVVLESQRPEDEALELEYGGR